VMRIAADFLSQDAPRRLKVRMEPLYREENVKLLRITPKISLFITKKAS